MATTDVNGMVFYTVTDPVEPLQTLLNGISTATTNAFNANVRIFPVANTTARAALVESRGASTSSPLVVYRQDTQVYEYTTNGSTWLSWMQNNNAWTPYTPTLSGASVGNGTFTARYNRIGSQVHEKGRFIYGSTSSVTGTMIIGTAFGIVDVSDRSALGAGYLVSPAGVASAAVARPWTANSFVVVGGTAFTWANNGSVGWDITYETA